MSEPRQTTWVAGEITGLDDERSIREGETAVERYHNSRDEARAQIMPMARGLLAAKRKYPATQEFGNWLDTSRYARLEKDDRAALIKIGEHEEFAIKFIRTTSLISPETIWDAIKERLPTSDDPNSTSNPPPAPEPLVSTGESAPPSAPPPASQQRQQLPPGVEPAVLYGPGSFPCRLGKASAELRVLCPGELGAIAREMSDRCGFADAPRAEEFHAIFRSKDARATLGRIWQGKHGPAIWKLMIKARDAGLLVENDRSFRTASLLLLFPLLPVARKYDLENPKHLALVRDIGLPAMIACRDKLLANPERAQEIVNEYLFSQETTEKNSTEEELHIKWAQDFNAILWNIMKIDEHFVSKYGHWRRWPVSDGMTDSLKRAVKFLSELIPTDA